MVFGTLATDSMSSALVLSLAGLTTAVAVAATAAVVPAMSELAALEKPRLAASLGGRCTIVLAAYGASLLRSPVSGRRVAGRASRPVVGAVAPSSAGGASPRASGGLESVALSAAF